MVGLRQVKHHTQSHDVYLGCKSKFRVTRKY